MQALVKWDILTVSWMRLTPARSAARAALRFRKRFASTLGCKPGDRVEFVVEAGQALIRLALSDVNPFARFIGIADPFPGGEEGIKAWIDDMRSDKDYE
jgi:hypothetical protein